MPLGPTAGEDSTGSSQRKTVVSIVVGLLVIAVVVVAGVYVVRQRDTAAAPTPSPSAGPTQPTPAEPPVCGDGDALLAAMSMRDKLAQMLMVGVTGADDARAVVAKEHVGGIMIGSWTDLTMLGDPLKEIAASAGALPLAVSTDEEGGRVSRLKSLIGVQESARVLGRTVSPQEVHDIALARGKAMKELGITVDFAPDADVSDQDDDTVIGDRSFSADPQKVTEYAGAYARGLLDAGVTPVLKHFPGHGHASGDSHEGGVVTPPLSDLMNDDLVPYRELAQVPGTAVMVGHMQVPGLTGTDPASLSPAAYSLLRTGGYGGLPFNGVVFTDDISSMGAINQRYTVAQAALKALQSGADIALWITTDEVPGVLDSLEAAVAAGELDPKNVDASVLRIAALKGKSPRCGG
ncbi:glycoside hydrolase family 3 protein [Mycolicibacterium sp. P1-18]|uniref:glycoside hydrolase family 3 N-terminal domain-containing protein n=1 Tax=Mycolicibacterium sp. P1-18 TaxID=2024615 RepID=UPI0011F37F55|nr:glycoside hydrolase family 3 N-terminal domain-containing protein [Mycolicibacterium sp. P1-18]KAA0102238.1 glycoside hydrolase family 3 protein [Mycolicibacterium sp. P1-18]